jgi:hypothetical protein
MAASILNTAVDISEVSSGKLVVLYGKSASGKTKVGSTFPKPMLYVKIGDDGVNTIKRVSGISIVEPRTTAELKQVFEELEKDKTYKSVFVDTFSLLVNEWKNENVIQKGKKMTQQLWGDLLTETEELIRLAHKLSKKKWVILSGHEVTDSIEGMEDELLPDVRISISKGARTYIEGMANFGIHTVKIQKESVDKTTGEVKEVVKYAADIGPNPYYWTKFQVDPKIKLPNRMINPSYEKIMKLIEEE